MTFRRAIVATERPSPRRRDQLSGLCADMRVTIP